MLEANSFGRVAPKIKTINVEANLLAQRLEERQAIRQQATRRLAALASCLLAACIALPPLFQLAAAASKAVDAAAGKEAELATRLRETQERRKNVQPILDEIDLQERCRRNAKVLIGETTLLLGGTSPRMAVGSVKAEVASGSLRLSVIAEAESYGAAREFVSTAGEGKKVESATLLSMRRSDTLGADGVRFEFVKKIGVKP